MTATTHPTDLGAPARLTVTRLEPAALVVLCPPHDGEVVTYVLTGALAQHDSSGYSGVLLAGEFQRWTAEPGVRHGEANASATDEAHAVHMWLRPAHTPAEPGRASRRFSTAQRRGVLCMVASPDGRHGSLRVHQDAWIYSAILGPGQHLAHALASPRRAWVHVVVGEIVLGDRVLRCGDGTGITAERVVSLTAHDAAEILLIDTPEPTDHA